MMMRQPVSAPTDTRIATAALQCHIEGVFVDSLLDEFHRAARPGIEQRGVSVALELIAWEPLAAAADRVVLLRALADLAAYLADSVGRGTVDLRAYPSHGNVCVTFDMVINPSDAATRAPCPEGDPRLAGASARIVRMGGEIAVRRRAGRIVAFSFWLPQWVLPAGGPRAVATRRDA